MLTEAEIFTQLSNQFRIARDQCEALGRGPNGPAFVRLGRAIDRIEGACRQMGHWRGDARWFRLGRIYQPARGVVTNLYMGQQWGAFARLVVLFEHGLVRVADLHGRATGRAGTMILPTAYEAATRH